MDSKNYLNKHKQVSQGLKEVCSAEAGEKENKMSAVYSDFINRERIRNFFYIDNDLNTDDLSFVNAHSHYAVEYLATMDEENFKALLLKFNNFQSEVKKWNCLIRNSWIKLDLLKEHNCFEEARKEFTHLEKLREALSKTHKTRELIRIASNLRCKLSKERESK